MSGTGHSVAGSPRVRWTVRSRRQPASRPVAVSSPVAEQHGVYGQQSSHLLTRSNNQEQQKLGRLAYARGPVFSRSSESLSCGCAASQRSDIGRGLTTGRRAIFDARDGTRKQNGAFDFSAEKPSRRKTMTVAGRTRRVARARTGIGDRMRPLRAWPTPPARIPGEGSKKRASKAPHPLCASLRANARSSGIHLD